MKKILDRILQVFCSKYFWMMFIGCGMTLVLLWEKGDGSKKDTIFNIIAMIGSGVLCSAFVSWLIEIQNTKLQEKKNQKTLKLLVQPLTNGFISLLRHLMIVINEVERTIELNERLSFSNENIVDVLKKCSTHFDKIDSYMAPVLSKGDFIPSEDIEHYRKCNEVKKYISNQKATKEIEERFKDLYNNFIYIKQVMILQNLAGEEQILLIEQLLEVIANSRTNHITNFNFPLYHKIRDINLLFENLNLGLLNLDRIMFNNTSGYLDHKYNKK